METISYTMVLHKHVDGLDTRFSTMVGLLVINPLGKWLGVIIIGILIFPQYQSRERARHSSGSFTGKTGTCGIDFRIVV